MGAAESSAEISGQTQAGTKFELNKFANRFERELPFGKSVKIFCLVGSQSGLDQAALGFGSKHVFNIFYFFSAHWSQWARCRKLYESRLLKTSTKELDRNLKMSSLKIRRSSKFNSYLTFHNHLRFPNISGGVGYSGL